MFLDATAAAAASSPPDAALPLRRRQPAVNKPFLDALTLIARSRAEAPGETYLEAQTKDPSAVVYVAFHQFFATQKYSALLGVRRAAEDVIIAAARDARVLAHTLTASAAAEIATLVAAAAAPELPFDFSVPAAHIPALRAAAKLAHAAALADARRDHANAVQAGADAVSTIRLYEIYRADTIYDFERTRDEIRVRKYDSRYAR